MRLADLLKTPAIEIDAKAASKKEAIGEAIALMAKTGALNDKVAYEKAVFAREEESTTGVGDGVAIPHAKGDFVTRPCLVAMVFRDGVAFDSLDGKPAQLLFLIAAPKTGDNVELDVLSRLSKLLMDEKLIAALIAAPDADAFLAILSGAERHRIQEEVANKGRVVVNPDIVAVTSCPNGIAHTYMAEEGLVEAAKRANLTIKVETDGASGVDNALTAQDIATAKGIIVAADAAVSMDRFEGRRVVNVAVSKAIKEPDHLVDAAVKGRAPVYHGQSGGKNAPVADNSVDEFGKETAWHKIYKYLMGGVSHMIPFVIGGGILIAIAFLIDAAAGNSGAGADFGSVNAVAAWFKTLGGYAFGFMLPVLAGFIAFAIAGLPALVVGFVGGYMATLSNFSIGHTVGLATEASAGFLGALAAGFAAGYIIVLLKKAFAWMPKSVEGMKGMLVFPVLGVLLIGVFMYLANTPFAYISEGFSWMLSKLSEYHLTVLLCAILAAMMVVDMGGPVNKAAYVFGTAMLAEGTTEGYMIMAAVMIGGMVPPIAIALSTALFPQKWSKKERGDAQVNYFLGLSFITEGAIPYAASYPLPVIGASVIGSAIAGALTGAFGVQLMAPHGGIFVFPVVQPIGWGVLWYLVALAVGSIIGALLLGVFMKNNAKPELGKWHGLYNVNTGVKNTAVK